MDLLKQQLQRIQDQLGALTASQRMLAFALVAIIVMTLLWWGRYAAVPEMVPVLDHPIAAGDMTAIKSALQAANITVRVENDRILVPTERQFEAIGLLGYARMLPSDSADAWDEIVNKNSNPLESAEKTSARFHRAKEVMLSQVLTRYFPHVRSARVFLDTTHRRRFGPGGDIEPSASVLIEAGPGAPIATIVDGAAATVASAQAGLKMSSVSVTVNGKPYRPRDPADANEFLASDTYERIQALERQYIEKIDRSLHFRNALVTVSVDLETQSSEETRKTYDPEGIIQKERRSETESSETTTAGPGAGVEPGAQANLPLSVEPTVAAAGSGGSSTVTERQKSEFEILASESVQRILKPGGGYHITRAAVRLPRSYFVNLYNRRNGSAVSASAATEPDDAALEPLIKPELDAVKNVVLASCGDIAPEAISVDVYDDLIPPVAAAAETVASASPASMGGLLGTHAKEIAIGGLAVLSLFMVSMMVRRSAPVTTISTPVELQEVAPLATDEQIAGEVGEGSAMLDGMELDEDTIKAQQMVEQVSTMVKENPDAAAGLVKRWLNRS